MKLVNPGLDLKWTKLDKPNQYSQALRGAQAIFCDDQEVKHKHNIKESAPCIDDQSYSYSKFIFARVFDKAGCSLNWFSLHMFNQHPVFATKEDILKFETEFVVSIMMNGIGGAMGCSLLKMAFVGNQLLQFFFRYKAYQQNW